jgi:hypothetical protein
VAEFFFNFPHENIAAPNCWWEIDDKREKQDEERKLGKKMLKKSGKSPTEKLTKKKQKKEIESNKKIKTNKMRMRISKRRRVLYNRKLLTFWRHISWIGSLIFVCFQSGKKGEDITHLFWINSTISFPNSEDQMPTSCHRFHFLSFVFFVFLSSAVQRYLLY